MFANFRNVVSRNYCYPSNERTGGLDALHNVLRITKRKQNRPSFDE